MRIDVLQNSVVVQSKTARNTATAPGFPLADAFFVLPPGTYDVVATPFDADSQPSASCAPASTSAEVANAMTTEIALVLQCSGPGAGGLDTIVTTSDPPLITNLTIDPSKFTATCAPITLAVSAFDPLGEALSYGWTVVARPAADPAGVVDLVASGASASFFADVAGDYTLNVAVTNTDGRTANLSFPIHVIAGDTQNCNARFDTLNPWSPDGEPVDHLTYGNRTHIFPVPGTILPDPPCTLTNHGGPVLASPVITPILWGSTVDASFASSVTTMFNSLFSDVTYQGYLQTVTQYTGAPTAGSVAPSVTLIPLNTKTKLSDTDIQAEIAREIQLGVLPVPTGNDLYTVFLPESFTATLGDMKSCVPGGFCAYHGSFQFNGVNATFAVMPQCDATICNPQVSGSHELIEAMTDPKIGFVGRGTGNILAWYDDQEAPCNGEVADLCDTADYTLGSFTMAAAWSNQLGQCEIATLNPPRCGHVGEVCCAGNSCSDTDSGCDSTGTCVGCPAAPPVPTLLTQVQNTIGSDCFHSNDVTVPFGSASCGAPGSRRVNLKTSSFDSSSDASCIARWTTNDPTDCRASVDYHVPTDCSKHIECDAQIFATSGALPATAERARLLQSDGHTLNSSHNYTIGGRCDAGFHRPATPPTPVVVSGDDGQRCAVNWLNVNDANDCTAVVTYFLGDLTKGITCDTLVVEIADTDVVPIGCH